MSLKADLQHETTIAGYKAQIRGHEVGAMQHNVRRAAANEQKAKIKADTAEVEVKTATVRYEIAGEELAIAQNDLTYTRTMGALKSEGQDLKIQIKSLKVRGTSAPSTSINRSAANNIKSRTRVPVEV